MTKAIGVLAGIGLLVGGAPAASAGDGAEAITPLSVGGTSELKSKQGAYAAAKALDGSTTTGWCEGVKGEGAGEALIIRGNDLAFSRLELDVGYWKSAKLFKANNQPLALAVSVMDLEGNAQAFDVAVEPGMSTTVLDVGGTIAASEIRIELVAVKKGKLNDSCLSEVRIFDGGTQRVPWFDAAAAIQDLQAALWAVDEALASCDAGALGSLFDFPLTLGGKKVKKLKDLVKLCQKGGAPIGVGGDLDFSTMRVGQGAVVYRAATGDYHLAYEYAEDGFGGMWKIFKVE